MVVCQQTFESGWDDAGGCWPLHREWGRLLCSQPKNASSPHQAHKRFLKNLEWAVDLPVSFSPGRLVCVHAGLNANVPAEVQLARLAKTKGCDPGLYSMHFFRPDPLHGCMQSIPSEVAACGYSTGSLAGYDTGHPDLNGKVCVCSGVSGSTSVNNCSQVLRCTVRRCPGRDVCTVHTGGQGSAQGFFRRGTFCIGSFLHPSQKIKGKILHLPNSECIRRKGILGL